jgi:hypothetical protein
MDIAGCARRIRAAMRVGSPPAVAVSMVTALLATTGPVVAAPELEPRNGRPECVGEVPGCRTLEGELIRIARDSEREVELACPGDAQFFWNWTAELGRHVQAQLLSPIRDPLERQIGARFAVSEHSDVSPGYARLFLGCSEQEPTRGELWVRYELLGYHPDQ